jgi:subtilisin family serine protease
VLDRQGYVTKEIETLDGLGLILARVEAPDNFNIKEAQASIRSILPDAIVDFNHVYHPGGEVTRILSADDASPSDLLDVQENLKASRRLIGVIDTNIDLTHRTLKGAKIQVRSFIPYLNHQPANHGTSIVSILVGDSRGFHGLLRNAEIYAASVFFDTPAGGQSTTTTSLVLALNWMIDNNVPVVNMSLTGPANAVLKGAIDRAYEKGLVIVAAVGNAGPNAAPLYPAAYDNVVAVTAVSNSNHVYRLANRGDYVDFSAPGVSIRHADAEGGFSVSSGTSYAAPFVAAVLSVSGNEAGAINAARLEELATHALDLGPEGYDPIYGYGLIRPLDN